MDFRLKSIEETAEEEMIEIFRTDQIGIGAFPNLSKFKLIRLLVTEKTHIVLYFLIEINVRVVI